MTPVVRTYPCSYPLGPDADPCRRPSVAIYYIGGEPHYRCKRHDSKGARATAEERGYERQEIAA